MSFDLVQIRKLAQEKEDENWEFREFLKTQCDLESEEIDRRVFEITKRVWAGIDCTACANCCREIKPTFSEEDIDRLARRLGMERRQFIKAKVSEVSKRQCFRGFEGFRGFKGAMFQRFRRFQRTRPANL
jgi:hypothetical protein